MIKNLKIKGDGFLLRSLEKADTAVLAKKINNRNIYRYTMNIPYPYKIRDARKWLDKVVRQYRLTKSDSFNLAIEIDGELSGGIGVNKIIIGHKAEMGYWLSEEHWGKGIMTRVVAKMTAYCFKKFRLKKIYAYVFVQNTGSYRVLAKNGFKKEGLLIQHVKKDGKLKDEYAMAKYKRK